MRIIALLALLLVPFLTGCTMQRPASQAYTVDEQGTVSAATRSALNGDTGPGKQEIVGVYIPFVGTGLALKAGLEWDGVPVVVTPNRAQAAPCSGPQTIEVEEVYTEMQPVQRTRKVQRQVVPIPVPQRAAPGCEPVAAAACESVVVAARKP